MLDHRSSVEHKQRRLLKIPRAINCGYVDKKISVVPVVNKVTTDNDNVLYNSEKLEERASNFFTTETWQLFENMFECAHSQCMDIIP